MPQAIDLTGKKFNRLTAIRFSHQKMPGYQKFWLFRCDCGVEKVIRSGGVVQGLVKSCGCYNRELSSKKGTAKRLDITGEKYKRLTALRFDKVVNAGTYWIFRCDCGKEKSILLSNVRSGKAVSCGCYSKEVASQGLIKRNTTHGLSRTRFYKIFRLMHSRCEDISNKQYHNYGGRGIGVNNRWCKFESFRDDMYESYLEHVKEHGEKNTSIDRIDNDGDYCKENCRWATQKDQIRNKRSSVKIMYKGRPTSLGEIAEITGISYGTLSARRTHGWSDEEIVQPLKIIRGS